MSTGKPAAPGLPGLARKLFRTGMDAVANRGELLLVEVQQEENRVLELVIWVAAVCFLAIMFFIVLTATVVYLFREDLRVYVAGGFSLLYLVGAVLALLNLKALANRAAHPFADSIAELKKDREWLESLK